MSWVRNETKSTCSTCRGSSTSGLLPSSAHLERELDRHVVVIALEGRSQPTRHQPEPGEGKGQVPVCPHLRRVRPGPDELRYRRRRVETLDLAVEAARLVRLIRDNPVA